MASRPHSVRFMSRRGGALYEDFEVPEGFRAVVMHISAGQWGAPAEVALFVHGVALWYWTRTGLAYESVFEAVRFTAYERETIRVATTGAGSSYSVDGYLLVDDDGRPDDADNATGPWPPGGALSDAGVLDR